MVRRPHDPLAALLPQTWLGRLGAALVFVAMVALGFVFFAFFLALFAVVAVVLAIRYFWFMRKLRKAAEQEFVHVEYTVEEEGVETPGRRRRLDWEDEQRRGS